MGKIPIQCTDEQLDIIAKVLYEGDEVGLPNISRAFDMYFSKEDDYFELIKEIKSCFERTDPPKWRAKNGEEFYYINETGEVEMNIEGKDSNILRNSILYQHGNYFRTKEQAETVAKKWHKLFSDELITIIKEN